MNFVNVNFPPLTPSYGPRRTLHTAYACIPAMGVALFARELQAIGNSTGYLQVPRSPTARATFFFEKPFMAFLRVHPFPPPLPHGKGGTGMVPKVTVEGLPCPTKAAVWLPSSFPFLLPTPISEHIAFQRSGYQSLSCGERAL